MSEIESQLERIVKEFAETDEALKDLYVQLKDLESVSKTYDSSRATFDEASARLETWTNITMNISSDIRAHFIQLEILAKAMDAVCKKLTDAEITTFNNKLDELKLVSLDLLEAVKGESARLRESEKQLLTTASENHDSLADQLSELMHRQASFKTLVIGLSSASLVLSLAALIKLFA